jgi:hypothetical protein
MGSQQIVSTPGLVAYPFASRTTDLALVAPVANYRIMRAEIYESGGTPAVASFALKTVDNSGAVLIQADLAADGTYIRDFGPNGIIAADGVYFDRVAGEMTGVVYMAAIPNPIGY